MNQDVFNRETLLDTVVNIVPIGILIVFFSMFLLSYTGELVSLATGVAFLLVVAPLVLLLALTYEIAKRI
ncbi:MAG: DUF6684 family protein [Halobacteria archaeon]|nr:DUF6684 family protein [Halobacteria archaeon]